MMAAPAPMPEMPLGAKPPVAGLVQLSGLRRVSPTAMKNRMIPILSRTMALFELAEARMPMTRTTVTSMTDMKAGMLAMRGTPNRLGAPVTAPAM